MFYAQVAIPKAIPKSLIYAVPESLLGVLAAGNRVTVPFHKRLAAGFVISIDKKPPPGIDSKKIRQIADILDPEPVFSKAMLELISWMSSYYLAPIGEVCRCALPPRLNELKGPKLTRPLSPLETWTASSRQEEFRLNAGQNGALETILANLKLIHGIATAPPWPRNDLKPILLHGITGSGKTEVYLRTFAEIKRTGGNGLLLVPEISLTPQLVERFRDRFGDDIAVYHSGLTEAQRQDQWERMRKGKTFAAVGTRSALFAPFENLKAIIVDEEHDGSYKQDDGFLYNARDCAVMRAKLENALIVMGSATPSFESFANAKSGKYLYCHLPERATGASLPTIEIVDMRQNAPQKKGALADNTIKAIEEALAKKEQILLLLNRRGFANFLLCRACGHVFLCPNCDISLTHHQSPSRLLCHYCDYTIPAPDGCPECKGIDLAPMGHGTQKLEGELSALFPNATIARLDRDTSSKVATRKTFLSKMQKGEIDILVGTQIIAKGHDFPNVTLVGVIDADVSLHLPDFRAHERTFQLLTQVAGRSGRADKAGRVIIQTYQPDHPSLIFAKDHDYASFFENEHEHRKALRYPPFSRAANMRFQANTEEKTERAANAALKILKDKRRACNLEKQVDLLGPAPAPLKKVRGKFRYQLLVKAPNAAALATLLNASISSVNSAIPSGCRVVIDVDPINML